MALTARDAKKWLGGRYVPTAIYFADSDCVEYVKEDAFCVYERIDEFLTLIFDQTKLTLIGFKLKGFKHFFQTHLKPAFALNDNQFLGLVTIIEAICTSVGESLFENDERAQAYKAARKLAANDNVKLHGAEFAAAA